MSLRQPLGLYVAVHRSFATAGTRTAAVAASGPSRLSFTGLHASRHSSTSLPRSTPISRPQAPSPSFPSSSSRPHRLPLPSWPRPSGPSHASAPTSSIFDKVFQRAFSSTPLGLVRQTYFPKKSNYGGGRQDRPMGWFSAMRQRIDRIPPMYIVYGIIGLNVAVFGLWQYAIQSWQRFHDPSLYHFLLNNFVTSEINLMSGRVWTLLTACFSHSTGTHIVVNCLSLYFVAPTVAALIGSFAFLGLYLGGGILASGISLAWHRFRGDKWVGSEGASGAIYASLAFYGAIFPSTQFLLFFVIPMPAWLLIGGLFAWDTYSAVARPGNGTDNAAHMGGLIAGIAAALWVRRRGVGRPRFGRFL